MAYMLMQASEPGCQPTVAMASLPAGDPKVERVGHWGGGSLGEGFTCFLTTPGHPQAHPAPGFAFV